MNHDQLPSALASRLRSTAIFGDLSFSGISLRDTAPVSLSLESFRTFRTSGFLLRKDSAAIGQNMARKQEWVWI